MMDNLMHDLEVLQISGGAAEEEKLWERYTESIQRVGVPERPIGVERPCEEKDYREYRASVDRELQSVLTLLRLLRQNRDDGKISVGGNAAVVRYFRTSLLLLVGEHCEKSPWNTAESVALAKKISLEICSLFEVESPSHLLDGESFYAALMALRPKLLKETWKKYPAAVTCYKWLLGQVQQPLLCDYIAHVLPTALIIFDDFVPENRLLGLECIYQILQHSYMRLELMENGYANVIHNALTRLTHQRDVRYILPLYACITSLVATIDFFNLFHGFEWSVRDDIISTLLDNMECEQNLELRRAYMLSLPQLLTNVGCAKWSERLIRVLAEYCGNHTDLRTLKATLQAAEAVLLICESRVPAHCDILYTAFLKLHYDLTETPVLDDEINQKLESCIYLLYKLTPTIGASIMNDDRVRMIIKNSINFAFIGDTKYCN